MTDEDMGYIAGMVDADGHIHTTRPVRLHVGNTSAPLIEWLVDVMGGNVQARAACLSTCENPHVHRRLCGYDWLAHGARAYILLTVLGPKMKVKPHRAAEAIATWEADPKHRYGVEVKARLDLIDRGWPIAPPVEIPHGDRRRYRRGCHCHECTAANTVYARGLRIRAPREAASDSGA